MKSKNKFLNQILCVLLCCSLLLSSAAAFSEVFKSALALEQEGTEPDFSLSEVATDEGNGTEKPVDKLDLPPSVPPLSSSGYLMIHNTSIPYRALIEDMYEDYFTEEDPVTEKTGGKVGSGSYSGSYSYTVTFTSDEPLKEAYEVTIYDEYYGSTWGCGKYLVYLADGDNKLYIDLAIGNVAKIKLPAGTSYTVEQTNAPTDQFYSGLGGWYDSDDNFVGSGTVSGTITAASSGEVRQDWYYTNLHMATLRLARFSRMPDPYGQPTAFDDGSSITFRIKLSMAPGYDIDPILEEYTASQFHIFDNITADIDGVYDLPFFSLQPDDEGYLTFELKYNEEIVIYIPEGTAYSIEELGDYRPNWYRYYPDEEAMVGPEPEFKLVILPIEEKTVDYAFDLRKDTSLIKYFCINYYAGDLTVSKKVSGTAADPEEEFEFTVTLEGTYEFAGETKTADSINGSYGDMYFEKGVAKFTLKDKESKTALDIPDGLTYKVVESNSKGYRIESTGEEGKIVVNKEAKAEFVNYKDLPEKPAESTTKPNESTTKPVESTTKPNESTTKPAESTTKPAEPTTKPVESTTKPVEPTTKPVEPTTKPVESTTKPVEPATKPIESTTAPAETAPDAPNTGDANYLSMWITLSAMSLLGLAILFPKAIRKEQ